MNSPSKSAVSFWQALILAVLFLTAGVWLASALSVLIMYGAGAWGGPVGAYLIDAGGVKVMRRCLLAVAIVFMMLFLRRAGWRGWKDCGFTTTDPEWSWRPWTAGLLNGMILGILTMGIICALTTLAGIHRLYTTAGPARILFQVLAFLLSALVIGFFEETLMRGILFRVLARIWRVWPAALLSSMIFAVAHFIEPSGEAFTGNSFLSVTQAVFVSTFTVFRQAPNLAIKFVNLSLLGIVLCAFVIRTKTIWLSVGAHAGWVWMIKSHGDVTMFYPPAPLAAWLGKRNDFMDSILAVIMLGGLLAWTILRSANSCRPMRRQGRLWRVAPGETERFTNWLDAHSRLETASGGRVLKEYPGCRVTALAGMIAKEYRSAPGWRGWRFGLRSSRARRAFITGRRLRACGIPTPAPIAWSIERRIGLRRSEAGITEELEQAEPLTAWLARRTSDPAARADVLRSYGRLAGAFHRNGFFNRDLKHENVMCSHANPRQLWVVDLDGVRRRGWITRRRAARDLRRVGLSLAAAGWSGAPDIAAFFEGYNASVPARLRRAAFPD